MILVQLTNHTPLTIVLCDRPVTLAKAKDFIHLKDPRGVILQRICSKSSISDCLRSHMKYKISKHKWSHTIPEPSHDYINATIPLFLSSLWWFCFREERFFSGDKLLLPPCSKVYSNTLCPQEIVLFIQLGFGSGLPNSSKPSRFPFKIVCSNRDTFAIQIDKIGELEY